jgi:hypothetical protein
MARAVRVYIDDGDERAAHIGAAVGIRTITPRRVGPIVLRFVAQGEFAEAVETRIIAIVVPRVKITIDGPVQSGVPGQEVTFSWQIVGAIAAYFEAPARRERHSVELSQAVAVVINRSAEEFLLTAVAFDGQLHSRRLSAVPRLIAPLDPPCR